MQSNSFFYKEYRLFAGGQTVDKPLCFLKMGSQGRSPRQGLGAVAPAKQPLPKGKGFGVRDREFALSYKKQTFSTT